MREINRNRAVRSSLVARMVLVGVLAAAAGLAHAEVKDSAPGGFTVENSRTVPVDAMTVWDALVTGIDHWWPKDHSWWGDASRLSIDARAGGCFCEIAGRQQAQHMTVTYVDPGNTLRMTGGLGPLQGMGLHGALEFRLVEAGNGATRITMYYRVGGYGPGDLVKLAPVVDRVQSLQLGGLADFLEQRAAP